MVPVSIATDFFFLKFKPVFSNFSKEPDFRRFKASRASHGWEAVTNHMWPDKPIRQAREPSEEFIG